MSRRVWNALGCRFPKPRAPRMPRTLLFLLLYFVSVLPAAAWGELGHRLIGELAERRLSPQARAQVQTLLAAEVEPHLAAVSTWPDAMRELPAYRWTAPLHYVQIRDASCRYDAARDCRNGECVVSAIERYARKLGDPSLNREERGEALKFLVHFVGDVHQPLHSGHRPDKGGNDFQISLRWRRAQPIATNLHSIWDYFLLASLHEDEADYVSRLEAIMPPRATTPIDLSSEPARWAENSCLLTEGEAFYPRRPGKLPTDYFDRMRPLAESRLQLAASRLAQLIEAALGEPP